MSRRPEWGRRSSDNQAYPKCNPDKGSLPAMQFPEGRHTSHRVSRLEITRAVRSLIDSLALQGWTVVDAYVIGSQISAKKPPHAKSDLDLMFMIDEYPPNTTRPPRGLRLAGKKGARLLLAKRGTDTDVQFAPKGSHPSDIDWMKDIPYKRVR